MRLAKQRYALNARYSGKSKPTRKAKAGKAAPRKRSNFDPVAADPTRTGMIRERFTAEFLRRFAMLQRELVHLIEVEDAFGLKRNANLTSVPDSEPRVIEISAANVESLGSLVTNDRWKFLTSQQKLTAFQTWLKSRTDSILLEKFKGQEDAYWKAYIEEGYKKGAGRAFDQTRKAGLATKDKAQAYYKGSKDEFFRTSFGPEAVDKVKLLASRTFTDIENVTSKMATQLSRILTDGLVQGQNPRAIAATMVKQLGISKSQATMIARTEIIRAHAEGQLDALDKLGVAQVGVMVEWSTAGDSRVCPRCSAMGGKVFTIKAARGRIPLHPNCRCAFVPAGPALGLPGPEGKGKKVVKAKPKLSATTPISPTVSPAEEAAGLLKGTGLDLTGSVSSGQLHAATTVATEAERMAKLFPAIAQEAKGGGALRFVNNIQVNQTGAIGSFDPVSGLIKIATQNETAARVLPRIGGRAWNVGEDIASVYRHEYGHRFYRTMSAAELNQWETVIAPKYAQTLEQQLLGDKPKKLKNVVSKYAQANPEELFAESFSAYTHAGYQKGSLPADLEKFLAKKLAQKKLPKSGYAPLKSKVLSLNTELRPGATAEEWKEFSKLAARRTQLNKIINAGNATQEHLDEAKEVKLKLESLRSLFRSRIAGGGAAPTPAIPEGVAAKFTKEGLPLREHVEIVTTLPGSTGPKLVVDAKGSKWVMKEGLKKGHAESEALADKLYDTLGVDVPKSGIVYENGNPVKFSEYIEGGEPLGKWLNRMPEGDKQRMIAEIQKNFVADSLLGNWDVAGMSMDNILVVKGKPIRIDNGGALFYRAQGELKTGWGKEVKELVDLRNPVTNPQTAQLFKDIPQEEINKQIRSVLRQRNKLLAEIADPKLKQVMSDRMDWLQEQLPKGGSQVTPEFVQEVKASRINGRALPSDRDDIEDMQLLVWEETDQNGKKVTRLSGKLTENGAAKLEVAMKDSLEVLSNYSKSTVADVTVHPQDTYWDPFLQAAKTINHHQADGAYNTATIAAFKQKQTLLEAALKADPDDEMLQYYSQLAHNIEKAAETQTTVAQITRYKVPPSKPKKAAEAAARPRVQTKVEPNRLSQAEIKNGHARRTAKVNEVYGRHLSMSFDEAEVRYFTPKAETGTYDKGRAFHNTIDITVDGEATPENIEKAQTILSQMGINPSAPTPEYEELVYLHKGVRLMKKDTLVGYKNIINADLPDAEKVDKVKDWIRKNTDVDPDKSKYYKPQGEPGTSFGDGKRYWYRWDLPPEQVEKEMGDYILHHSTSRPLHLLVDDFLQSGGQATSTVERVRKGINLTSTGGMSSLADINSGGADFFFTRIYKKTTRSAGIRFKIRNLARQDVVSYSDDKYGSMDALGSRKTDIEGWKKNATGGSNETLLRHGVSFLDEIETIHVPSALEKDKVIAAFHKNKIKTLPDGRKVEDVVVATGYH